MANLSDEDDLHYKFKIGMLVRHPKADLGLVLEPLGQEPDNNRVAGDRRMAPNGQLLAGRYPESFWNWRRLVECDRHFMASVSHLIETLEPHGPLLRSISEDGGSVAITLALPGLVNIGSSIDFKNMARLADLKTNLDIEVFPDLNNFR